MGGDAPGADPNVGLAAMRNSQNGEEALRWYQETYRNDIAPMQREQAGLNRRIIEQQMRLGDEQAQIARDDRAYSVGTYRPIEQRLAAEAQEFNTEDFRNREAEKSGAAVRSSFSAARAAQNMDLARQGINVGSGAALAMDNDTRMAEAISDATASNDSRERSRVMGTARLMDVANMGRGVSNGSQAAQLAMGAGNSASGIAGANLAGVQQGAQGMMGAHGTAGAQFGQAGSLYGQASAQNVQAGMANASNNQQMIGAGVGGIAMVAAAAF